MIPKILHSLLEQLHLPVTESGTAQALSLIKDKNPELGILLQSLIQADESHRFIRNDYELRHKLKDIWTFQCNRTKSELENYMQLLADYCQNNDLKLPEEESIQI
jgi:hypothetical protein